MPIDLPSVSNRERNAPSTGVERGVGSEAIRSVMTAAFARGVWNELRILMNALPLPQVLRAKALRDVCRNATVARSFTVPVIWRRGDGCG